ncbi:hypothetical protein [Parasphingopyxis marina]|uniref:Uncharacterized protein n=1 Tax=Parasphingopyxis marina TaxID=2761622 RepID=A0A842I1T9_9SPHN|nr:hypothetical protein [Parasphingopyxis marina]MBC2778190.1 hypothetical protein [Parasphingopyxis marina]
MSAFRFAPQGLVRIDSPFAARCHPVARYAGAKGRKASRLMVPRSAPDLRVDRGRLVRADRMR